MCEQPPMRVALVEDDARVAGAIVRALRLMGMCAQHFTSAENLLMAGDVSPGCYVIDVHLPGMSGLDLQRQLRSTLSRVPVIFITGDDSPDLKVDAIYAGAAALLTKPFTGRALAEIVRSIAWPH